MYVPCGVIHPSLGKSHGPGGSCPGQDGAFRHLWAEAVLPCGWSAPEVCLESGSVRRVTPLMEGWRRGSSSPNTEHLLSLLYLSCCDSDIPWVRAHHPGLALTVQAWAASAQFILTLCPTWGTVGGTVVLIGGLSLRGLLTLWPGEVSLPAPFVHGPGISCFVLM